MSIDLKNMSVAELLDLQKAIPAELEARQKEERQKLLNEFRDKAKSLEALEDVVITESALDHQEVALAFKPRPSWPKAFRYYPLYR